jgi:hypothetical protein
MIGDDGNVLHQELPPMLTSQEIMSLTHGPSIMHTDEHLLNALDDQVKIFSLHPLTRANAVTAKQLAQRWNTGLNKAKKTLNVTSQRGTHTVAYPSLNARFCTDDRQIQYR